MSKTGPIKFAAQQGSAEGPQAIRNLHFWASQGYPSYEVRQGRPDTL